jgi:hypothetical protein
VGKTYQGVIFTKKYYVFLVKTSSSMHIWHFKCVIYANTEWYHQCFPRAFQWMVMSVGVSTIIKYFGQFQCSALGDRNHHQSLKELKSANLCWDWIHQCMNSLYITLHFTFLLVIVYCKPWNVCKTISKLLIGQTQSCDHSGNPPIHWN